MRTARLLALPAAGAAVAGSFMLAGPAFASTTGYQPGGHPASPCQCKTDSQGSQGKPDGNYQKPKPKDPCVCKIVEKCYRYKCGHKWITVVVKERVCTVQHDHQHTSLT